MGGIRKPYGALKGAALYDGGVWEVEVMSRTESMMVELGTVAPAFELTRMC